MKNDGWSGKLGPRSLNTPLWNPIVVAGVPKFERHRGIWLLQYLLQPLFGDAILCVLLEPDLILEVSQTFTTEELLRPVRCDVGHEAAEFINPG